jgi:acyl-CoA-binding protein
MAKADDFKAAVAYVQGLPKDGKVQPSNAAKLAFYALFKQATQGPNPDPAPSRFKIVERAKCNTVSSVVYCECS